MSCAEINKFTILIQNLDVKKTTVHPMLSVNMWQDLTDALVSLDMRVTEPLVLVS